MRYQPDSSADQLASYIRRLSEHSARPFVVAIDGRSGAGKTSLARRLNDRLDTLVLSGDDFYAGGVTLRQETPAELADICIDWRHQKAVLASLLNSGVAQYHPFDWAAFDGSTTVEPVISEARPVIVLEGVYSARAELRELCNLLVLLEVEDDLRARQLLQREGEISEWEKQWHLAENWYFQNSSPREVFDLVVSSDGCEGL